MILREPGDSDRTRVLGDEIAVVQDVRVRDHHALGIARRSRRVLQKENLRCGAAGIGAGGVDKVLGDNPLELEDVARDRWRSRRPASGEVRCQRAEVVPARQDRGGLAIARDVRHLVESRSELVRARRIDRDGDQAGTHAGKERANHLETRRVSEENPVVGSEPAFAPQVSGDDFHAVQEVFVPSSGPTLDRSNREMYRAACSELRPSGPRAGEVIDCIYRARLRVNVIRPVSP